MSYQASAAGGKGFGVRGNRRDKDPEEREKWYMQGPDEMRLDLGEATLRTGAVWEFGRAPFPAISLAIQVLRGPDIPQLLADKLTQMLFSRCAWIPQQSTQCQASSLLVGPAQGCGHSRCYQGSQPEFPGCWLGDPPLAPVRPQSPSQWTECLCPPQIRMLKS